MLSITGAEAEARSSTENETTDHQSRKSPVSPHKRVMWWIQMVIYTIFVLGGATIATVLGRLYYDKGGNSNWLATFVQTAGFPVVLPFLCISRTKSHNPEIVSKKASSLILFSFYVFLGVFLAVDCMLYSIGLRYLPVSTYTLICASQLGFNALFSYFLNAQKFTPYIINSILLLTISSTLLVFNNDTEESNKISKKKYVMGFLCTVGASAGFALMLSATQLAFQKIIKRETFRAILDMSLYQNLVATLLILIGLFVSGDWKTLGGEMKEYKLGKVSYVMNLIWTAISWQAFVIGCVGIIFKTSALFSNVISMLGVPIGPVMGVIVFQDKFTGVKVMSMILAMWGSASYFYQQYIDDLNAKAEGEDINQVSQVAFIERV